MIRPHFAFATLLLTCTASAAPAPKPQPFVSGWDNPIDPDKDCKIQRDNDSLTIEMPGSDHDYDLRRGQINAPRLLRERQIEGDFIMQVRVRIDSRPSVQSTVDGQASSVSGGFLVIMPANAPALCYRMDFRTSRKGGVLDAHICHRIWGHNKKRGGMIAEGTRELENGWKGDAHLRLERRDGNLVYYASSDGENWKNLGGTGGIHEKLKVGLAAYSSSTERFQDCVRPIHVPA
jgi:hypothetical protein